MDLDPILGVGPRTPQQYNLNSGNPSFTLTQNNTQTFTLTASQNFIIKGFFAYVRASASTVDGGITCSVSRNGTIISSSQIDSNYISTNLLQGQQVYSETLGYLTGATLLKGETLTLTIAAGASGGITWTLGANINLIAENIN